jgi:isopentenyl-diphosphate delta-isomerase
MDENVVLLDETGRASGVADKYAIHGADTPLHLAFSCYVFDDDGRFLLTRRAWSKRTWPGVWTNSCCGHPLPGEPVADSARRRLRDELGVAVTDLELVLPGFRYRAEMPIGVVENEMCPVFRARLAGTPEPNPDEVAEVDWVDWADFTTAVRDGDRQVSPWCALQIQRLSGLGGSPWDWAVGDPAELPPAALAN